MQATNPILGLLACALSVPAFSQSSSVVGFDGGADGGFTGNAFFEVAGGNPDGNAHFLLTAFFMSLRTGGLGEPVNPNFIGDYSPFDQVSFGFDVKVDSLTDFIGNQIVRPIGIALIDRDIQGPSGPSGVFFELSPLSQAGQPDWTNLSVTIDDPTSATLPMGWIGFGDEDPNTFEPILPPGATFATVLAGVDEFQVSGAVPGFFFTNANFDVRIDNVAVTVSEPNIGSNYCDPAVPHSGGLSGVITATGDATAGGMFTLTGSDLPAGENGIFLASPGSGVFMPPASQGFFCLGGGGDLIGRFLPPVTTDGAGTVSIAVDSSMIPTAQSSAGQPIPIGMVPGDTWNFQLYFRDGANTNFTDATAVTFQ